MARRARIGHRRSGYRRPRAAPEVVLEPEVALEPSSPRDVQLPPRSNGGAREGDSGPTFSAEIFSKDDWRAIALFLFRRAERANDPIVALIFRRAMEHAEALAALAAAAERSPEMRRLQVQATERRRRDFAKALATFDLRRGKPKPPAVIADADLVDLYTRLRKTIQTLQGLEKVGDAEGAARHLVDEWGAYPGPGDRKTGAVATFRASLLRGGAKGRWRALIDSVSFHWNLEPLSGRRLEEMVLVCGPNGPRVEIPSRAAQSILAAFSGVSIRRLQNRLAGLVRPRGRAGEDGA